MMLEDNETGTRTIAIDSERCIRCGECIDICPQTRNSEFPVFTRDEDGMPVVANIDSCIACLSCEVNCRAMAIRLEDGVSIRIPASGEVRAELKSRAMF